MTADTTTGRRRGTARRLMYAALAVLLLVAFVFEAVEVGTGYRQIAVFGLGPDLALLFGAGSGLERGQLHPRAVRLYNLVHRFWGPLALAVLAALEVVFGRVLHRRARVGLSHRA